MQKIKDTIRDIFRNVFSTQKILRTLAVFIDNKLAEFKIEIARVDNNETTTAKKLEDLIQGLSDKKVFKFKKVKE
jgi:hypothetical protein